MDVSPTHPVPPAAKTTPGRPLLRRRWRGVLIVGMSALVLLLVGTATLITALQERQALQRLQRTAAAQTQRLAAQTIRDLQQELALSRAALTADPEQVGPVLTGLLAANPAIASVVWVGADALPVYAVPSDIAFPDWRGHPAFSAAAAGEYHVDMEDGAPGAPVVLIAVPGPQPGSALIVQALPAALWSEAVAPAIGAHGYAYVLSAAGALLVAPADRTADSGAAFDALIVVREAQTGHPTSRIYRGLEGELVVGRAQHDAAIGITVVTETPLTDFTAVAVRLLALWMVGLGLSVGLGEWMLRRMLDALVGPLRLLRTSARAASAGDYRVRVRLPAGADGELTDLAGAFNALIARLGDSQRQIESHTNQIQEIVDLRARELSRKTDQLEVAAVVARSLTPLHDPRVLAARAAELITARFKVYHVELLLLDVESGRLLPGDGVARAGLPEITLRDSATSVIAWVAAHNKACYVPDVSTEPRYRRAPDVGASRCELALPLLGPDGRAIGVLNLEADHRDAFLPDQIAVLEGLAEQIAASLQSAQAFRVLEQSNVELAQATQQANQANILKSRFLYNAAQKLRLPLDEMVSTSETLLSGVHGALPAEALERQRRILEHGRVIQALVEDMLDLSAIEAGHLQLNLQPVPTTPLLEEIVNAARALHTAAYPTHTLTIRLDLLHLTEPLPPVRADIDRLRYILINLMSNAIIHTPAGEVVLSGSATDTDVLITVRDTGPGIGDETLRYLFEPFQQQRAPKVIEDSGTGLGLPVARLLAMRHGGDLTVETRQGEGTIFTLRLPRAVGGPPTSGT